MTLKYISRLVLGTAQLGMPYGIANQVGKPDSKTAENIIKTAWGLGIREFDTAQGYEESEQILGRVFSSLGINDKIRVISKLHPKYDHLNDKEMLKALELTLSTLKISKLYALLLHEEEYLDLWDRGLGSILYGFIEAGFVEYLGVSIYSTKRAIQAIATSGISIIQIPSNILDRRFEKADVFSMAEDRGKQIYVRSVFLQGVLLMDSNSIPPNIHFISSILKQLKDFTLKYGLSREDLALGYVKGAYPRAKIIFGVETTGQLKNNVESWRKDLSPQIVKQLQEEFHYVDEKVLNPMLW